jgi:hypothetical protein
MIIKTKIEFEFNTDDIDLSFESPAEAEEYAKSAMVDDIYSMVKYNEVAEAIRVEVIA